MATAQQRRTAMDLPDEDRIVLAVLAGGGGFGENCFSKSHHPIINSAYFPANHVSTKPQAQLSIIIDMHDFTK